MAYVKIFRGESKRNRVIKVFKEFKAEISADSIESPPPKKKENKRSSLIS